jgi:hypothetical protein
MHVARIPQDQFPNFTAQASVRRAFETECLAAKKFGSAAMR